MKRQDLLAGVQEALADGRSRRVVLVAHCLLNQNTRYQGGASCPGCDPEVLRQLAAGGAGLIQMPCPEVKAWGGLAKAWLWLPVGRKPWSSRILQAVGLPLFILWTRWSFHWQARGVVGTIRQYQRSGFTVETVVGIDGSPSCGVRETLDLRSCFSLYSQLDPQVLERQAFNQLLYQRCLVVGSGYFVASLRRQLARPSWQDHGKSFSKPDFLGRSLPEELQIGS